MKFIETKKDYLEKLKYKFEIERKKYNEFID